MSGLLAAGAVSASLQVAHADTIYSAACGGNSDNSYICNMDTEISDAGSITVSVDSGSSSENVNVSWTVECTDSAGAGNQEGATDNAATPLTVPLTPLPSQAADGQCSVNVGITLPAHVITPEVAYTGQLTYTTASSTPTSSSSAVHPVKGYGGTCLDDKGNSSANRAAVVIWSCGSSDQAENWSFSNGELKHNGKCLNDQGSAGSGGHVILYSCSSGSNGKWSELANGELELKAHNGTLCLDDPRSSTKNGTQLIVYGCHDSANQKWSLP